MSLAGGGKGKVSGGREGRREEEDGPLSLDGVDEFVDFLLHDTDVRLHLDALWEKEQREYGTETRRKEENPTTDHLCQWPDDLLCDPRCEVSMGLRDPEVCLFGFVEDIGPASGVGEGEEEGRFGEGSGDGRLCGLGEGREGERVRVMGGCETCERQVERERLSRVQDARAPRWRSARRERERLTCKVLCETLCDAFHLVTAVYEDV